MLSQRSRSFKKVSLPPARTCHVIAHILFHLSVADEPERMESAHCWIGGMVAALSRCPWDSRGEGRRRGHAQGRQIRRPTGSSCKQATLGPLNGSNRLESANHRLPCPRICFPLPSLLRIMCGVLRSSCRNDLCEGQGLMQILAWRLLRPDCTLLDIYESRTRKDTGLDGLEEKSSSKVINSRSFFIQPSASFRKLSSSFPLAG
ncbi:hypothetical protein VTO42DRAFT_3352 [Malbranchea cinnamomea]